MHAFGLTEDQVDMVSSVNPGKLLGAS
jgi:hypothetical protein